MVNKNSLQSKNSSGTKFTRKPHYLKENASSETIHECIFYDTETHQVPHEKGQRRHVLVFGWAAYLRRDREGRWRAPQWIRFDRGDVFWRWVDSKAHSKRTMYLWAHNQGFDYVTSDGPAALHKMGWEMTDAIVDQPPFILVYRKGTRKLVITDTINIWRMPLWKLAKLAGLEKLEMPSAWTGLASDDAYCKRDVEIIATTVTEWADFLASNQMGKFQLTVAGQSMSVYRHCYLHHEILIDDHEPSLEVARAAYHGGRVECNFIGARKGHFYLLDINSLYPSVMQKNEFPVKLIRFLLRPSLVDLRNLIEKYLACAHIRVRLRAPVVPVKMNHKLIFPTGEFDCYVSTPELKYLFDHECLLRCHSAALYEKAVPFQEFVTDLYARRTEAYEAGNLVEREHYKWLLNSFSGKWGQNGTKWRTVSRTSDMTIGFARSINAFTDEVIDYRRFNGLWQRKDVLPESTNSHPAIAAHITAYGRMELWALIERLEPEDYFYADTDAVLCSDHAFDKLVDLVDDTKLGALKIVGEYRDIRIYGPKDYELDGKRTIKGVRYDAKTLDAGIYEQTRWSNFKGLLRGKSIAAVLMSDQTKRLRRVYGKGLLTATGYTRPFHLPEESGLVGG